MKEYKILEKIKRKMKFEYDFSKTYNVYAVITDKKGKIISLGRNSYIKTHPQQKKYNIYDNPYKIFLHAEIDALLKCKNDNAHTMIVVRMTKQGFIKNAKPCLGCTVAIKNSNIKKVYFTNNNGELVLLNTD